MMKSQHINSPFARALRESAKKDARKRLLPSQQFGGMSATTISGRVRNWIDFAIQSHADQDPNRVY